MAATGWLPFQGKMSRSSQLRMRLERPVAQLGECLMNHSRAAASKLLADDSSLAAFCALRCRMEQHRKSRQTNDDSVVYKN